MQELPKKLKEKLANRKYNDAFRSLNDSNNLVDFSSNDYLGFSKSNRIYKAAHKHLVDNKLEENGSTGSRLLSGNHKLYQELEAKLCELHKSESALVFNSGYDANLGFFSCVPQRNDIIIYDAYCHASIRDGIKLSNAKAYKFAHNNLNDLSDTLTRVNKNNKESIYTVTESVFSMDGDSPNLTALSKLCLNHNANLIIDEAHAIGLFGATGFGIVQELGLENEVFARIVTFGKAMGCHGAAILGSTQLVNYLVNYSRSFIYSTALPPHSIASIYFAYEELIKTKEVDKIHLNIQFFKSEIKRLGLEDVFMDSDSAIQCCIISGNEHVKHISQQLFNNGFNVKPILSPTVAKGQERLRFCIHSHNSREEITKVLRLLATFTK